MSAPDYYRILHVQPDAPAPIIHASYRTLVQRAFGLCRARAEESDGLGARQAQAWHFGELGADVLDKGERGRCRTREIHWDRSLVLP